MSENDNDFSKDFKEFRKKSSEFFAKEKAKARAELQVLDTLRSRNFDESTTLDDVLDFCDRLPEELSEAELQKILEDTLERFKRIRERYK